MALDQTTAGVADQSKDEGNSQSNQLSSSPTVETKSASDILKSHNPPTEAPKSDSDHVAVDAPDKSKEAAPTTSLKADEQKALGSKFAALVRKEKAAVARQEELKAQSAEFAKTKAQAEAELAASRQKHEVELKDLANFNQLKKVGALKALEALGYTYQQATDELMNDGTPTPEAELAKTKAELKADLEAFKAEQLQEKEKERQAAEEARQKKDEAEKLRAQQEKDKAIEDFRGEIKNFLKTNAQAYELTNLDDPEGQLILEVINEKYEQTLAQGKPQILTIKEASDIVEVHFEKQVQQKLATSKFRAKVNPPDLSKSSPEEGQEAKQTPGSATEQSKQPVSSSPKTITNDMANVSTSSAAARSEKERWDRAIAAMSRTG